MSSQMVFRRYEYKYLLTRKQQSDVLSAMAPYMVPEAFPHSIIRNIYYDTPDFRLIRTSLEQPVYKEKLRIRSYGSESKAYIELKKKYDGIVYKRRISVPRMAAMDALNGTAPLPDCQIGREIQSALQYYGTLQPMLFLRYDRDAYCAADGSEFRLTFDDSIRCRWDRLNLDSDEGTALLPPDTVLMELKISGSMPFWMARLLSDNGIHKTSFSKYGCAYQRSSGTAPLEGSCRLAD